LLFLLDHLVCCNGNARNLGHFLLSKTASKKIFPYIPLTYGMGIPEKRGANRVAFPYTEEIKDKIFVLEKFDKKIGYGAVICLVETNLPFKKFRITKISKKNLICDSVIMLILNTKKYAEPISLIEIKKILTPFYHAVFRGIQRQCF
jgi:hypothetical protein